MSRTALPRQAPFALVTLVERGSQVFAYQHRDGAEVRFATFHFHVSNGHCCLVVHATRSLKERLPVI